MNAQELEGVRASETIGREVEDALDSLVFEFREVTEVGEVEQVLALRHRVYSGTEAVRGFIDPQGPRLLMDHYDRFSRLFGLFVRRPAGSRLIGTVRAVGMDPGPAGLALEMIAAPHPRLLRRLRTSRQFQLPFLAQFSNQGVMEARVTRAMARGEVIAEAGRFAIDPEFRAGRGTQLHLARHMIESVMAHLFVPNGYDHAFIACDPGHIGMYQRVGFRVISGPEPIQSNVTGTAVVCLELTRDAVVGDVRLRALACAAELVATGRIVLGAAGSEREDWPLAVPRFRHVAPSAITHPALCVSTAC